MLNFDPAWLLALFPAAILISGYWQSRQTEKGRRYRCGPPQERPSNQDDKNGPFADITALIHAVQAEGRANRREEVREDRGKKCREWITILLIGATLYAVWRQVGEMIKVYDPIAEQAKVLTDTESRQLRAYVYSVITRFSPNLQPNAENIFSVRFVNGGATPAYIAAYELNGEFIAMPFNSVKLNEKESFSDGWPGSYLFKEHVSEYNSVPLLLSQDQIDAVKGGRGGIFFLGHIIYKDVFGCRHHTNFCMGYFSQRGAPPGTYDCISHNDVDAPDQCGK